MSEQATVERLISVCCTLLEARALVVECRKQLRCLDPAIEWLRPVVFMMFAVLIGGLMTKAFGTKELRDKGFEVLAEMVKEEA